MTVAMVYSRANVGIHAPLVTVETHISNGLPGFSIVGLAETTVKESKDRVRSALINSQFEFPIRRITVNLAPADLPKEGGRFDLPIALSILAASSQIPMELLQHYEFVGELALTGELRSIKGVLPIALATANHQRALIVPLDNAQEAGLSKEVTVFPAKHLLDVCAHLTKTQSLVPHNTEITSLISPLELDFADVRGQQQTKRVLEIAAAGHHSLLMTGPPGTGKTMLANRFPSIMPPMNEQEALEVAAVYSISTKKFLISAWRQRPFRAPHHTASSVALVGGGSPPKPGEISLAHQGVLFLDELPEFQRHVLEALREPLESGHITISRAAYQTQFPSKFLLVAAMNPCPCGYLGDLQQTCRCSPQQIQRYQTRLSGPFLDRIDLAVRVPRLAKGMLSGESEKTASSAEIKQRVIAAREIQYARLHKVNAAMQSKEIEKFCQLHPATKSLLENAIDKFNLSTRSYYRILKVARTIADLAASETIEAEHLAESLSYRHVQTEA